MTTVITLLIAVFVAAIVALVRTFAGDDYEVAVVPSAARTVLSRFDERSAHYEVRDRRVAGR